MESNRRLMIDASYLVSFYWEQDSLNARSKELLEIVKAFSDLFISNYVYLEVATVLSQRLSKVVFKEVDRELSQLHLYEMVVGETLHKQTKQEFMKVKEKDISFVDVSSVLIMKECGIGHLLTFDHHFVSLKHLHRFEIIN